MNLELEKGERVRSLGWLEMCLPWMAWEKGMERLVDGSWKSAGIAGGWWV